MAANSLKRSSRREGEGRNSLVPGWLLRQGDDGLLGANQQKGKIQSRHMVPVHQQNTVYLCYPAKNNHKEMSLSQIYFKLFFSFNFHSFILLSILGSSSPISRCLWSTFPLHYGEWQIYNCSETCECTPEIFLWATVLIHQHVKLVWAIDYHNLSLWPNMYLHDRNYWEKTMNEKTVGGETHTVIRHHTDDFFLFVNTEDLSQVCCD